MRVIAGSAKRTVLKTIEGENTRPTTDRMKETLFNMIQYEITDTCFLDIFSGSGGIGIEALSRGAKNCVFIENNKKAVECIQYNLNKTQLFTKSEVFHSDHLTALDKLEAKGKCFDTIFMDPPYDKDLEKETLIRLAGSALIHNDSVIIVEASFHTPFDYLEDYGYYIRREKKYKTNKHVFIGIGEE